MQRGGRKRMRMLVPGTSRLEDAPAGSGPAAAGFKPPKPAAVAAASHTPAVQATADDSLSASAEAPQPQQPAAAAVVRKPVLLRTKRFQAPSSSVAAKAPPSSHSPALPAAATAESSNGARYFLVYYAKNSTKKHKNWMDGVAVIRSRTAELHDMEAKSIGKKMVTASSLDLEEGSQFPLGGWLVEIVSETPAEKFLSGSLFVQAAGSGAGAAPTPAAVAPAAPKFQSKFKRKKSKEPEEEEEEADAVADTSDITLPDFSGRKRKLVLRSPDGDDVAAASKSAAPRWKHSPHADDAVVLNQAQAEAGSENFVVVEPFLARQLRPHQVEGVQFLYQCLMGLRDPNHQGAILGDEMGLGKTVQAITAAYTLLTDGPRGRPAVTKVIVVVPSSLVQYWRDEFWNDPHPVQEQVVQDFVRSLTQTVLVVGYELFRKHAALLAPLPKALVICDEGHRLKNSAGNQTIAALNSCVTRKRIILTGTPIQNNLSEYYAMCDFVNPGILGSLAAFRNAYEVPITRGREQNCSEQERELSEARSRALAQVSASFVLRRTADLNRKHLPSKVETVVFCPLTPTQQSLYQALLRSKEVLGIMSGRRSPGDDRRNHSAAALACLTMLKKLCTHPGLVAKDFLRYDIDCDAQLLQESAATIADAPAADDDADAEQKEAVGEDDTATAADSLHAQSGKLVVLAHLIREVCQNRGQKMVIVSNYTESLDLVRRICVREQVGTLRLDGNTPGHQRQSLVNTFNSRVPTMDRVFLLSAKAGGVGLNLVGGSHLVLLDPDWNPATDLQAMARVWRDGQKRTVHIYRLLSTGTVEEKIFQRQLRKQEVAQSVMDDEVDLARNFTGDQIKELFRYNDKTRCETHYLLTSKKRKVRSGEADSGLAEPDSLGFAYSNSAAECAEESLHGLPASAVSFVFLRRTDPQELDSSAEAQGLAASVAASKDNSEDPEVTADPWEQLMDDGDDEDSLVI